MLITITQKHVDKAYVDERTKTLSQACPIWQALNEIGLGHLSVGYGNDSLGKGSYLIRNKDTNTLVATIRPEHPLWNLADWFDSPCTRGIVKLDAPISADVEMLA